MQEALTEGSYYILLSLTVPRHGYGIMQYVAKLSGGRVRLAAGTLYGALANLQKKGWIQLEAEDKGKKQYLLTAEGLEAVKTEFARLEELGENGRQVLGGK